MTAADFLDPRFSMAARELCEQGMRSLFSVFEGLSGALAVDQKGHIVWLNEQYEQVLGFKYEDIKGRHIHDVIPNSLLPQVAETGEPILLDIMQFKQEWFVVTRVPIFDDREQVVGAMGFVLMNKVEGLKPLMSKVERLQKALTQAQKQIADGRNTKYRFSNFIGNSKEIQETKREARRAAQLDSPVLLLGETGTGKEMLAQAIHNASPRSEGPFVSVNVAAIPETLLEAEFFGVAPGAYTGADRKGRDGKLKLATGGTLFLDEIGDMPLHLQTKLLRTLQEKEFERVGSNKVEQTDIRVIAATSRNLQALIKQGNFRADLYYRINVFPVRVPPLRDRLADIPILCDALLEQIVEETGLPPKVISQEAMEVCSSYSWPGNVRELRNVLERVTALTDHEVLSAQEFRQALPEDIVPIVRRPERETRSLVEAVQEAERKVIRDALEATGNNKLEAAKLLDISRGKLYDRLKALAIKDQ